MGEYARYGKHDRIKIGTCEDLYYLRADQAHLVTAEHGSVDPVKDAESLRFRFPFPDEDHVAPGEFRNYKRTLGLHIEDFATDIEHYDVQFKSNGMGAAGSGVLVSLPCPLSPQWEEKMGTKAHFNGFSGQVQIRQQRLVEGKLLLVCECGSCGAAYRVDAESIGTILDKLEKDARSAIYSGAGGETRAHYLRTIAQRIQDGYDGILPVGLARYSNTGVVA